MIIPLSVTIVCWQILLWFQVIIITNHLWTCQQPRCLQMKSWFCPNNRIFMISLPVPVSHSQYHKLIIVISGVTSNWTISIVFTYRKLIVFTCCTCWIIICHLLIISSTHILIFKIAVVSIFVITVICRRFIWPRHIGNRFLQIFILVNVLISCTTNTYIMIEIVHVHHIILISKSCA